MTNVAKLFNDALAALNSRKLSLAETAFRKVLERQPDHVPSLNLLTAVLMSVGRFAEAEPFIAKAVTLDPRSDASFYNYGLICKALHKPDQALEHFSRSLAINSGSPQTWNNRGTVFNDLGRLDLALHDFDRAIALAKDYADAYVNKAKALAQLKRYDEALLVCDTALAMKPQSTEGWVGRGNVADSLGRYGEAIGAFDSAIALNANLVTAWLGRGNASTHLNRYDDALAAFDKALALAPDLAEAWLGRGNVFSEFARHDDAFAAYDRALALRPDLAEAWVGRGNVLYNRYHYDQAIDSYDRALALNPESAAAWLGRGNALTDLGRFDEAIAAHEKALALKPDLAGAWAGRGSVFTAMHRYEEAFAAYDHALALKPDLAEAWLGRGSILHTLGRHEESIAALDRAMRARPQLHIARAIRLSAKMLVCDWADFSEECDLFTRSLRSGRLDSDPFVPLSIPSVSSEDQLNYARIWTSKRFPAIGADTKRPLYQHRKIRLGYVSSDFREHPVSHLTVGLFEHHDRSRFEVLAISLGPDDGSEMRHRLQRGFDTFVDASSLTDEQIRSKIGELEIDILVDLNGHTRGRRLELFAHRSAPLQVHYLGFAGTVGADYIDYLIADATIVAPQDENLYAEKIVRLPHSFQASDDTLPISDRAFTRAECGLPERAFVYCCFNNTYKLNPPRFDCWARILGRVEGSVLWLRQDNPTVVANLRKEASRRGIDPARLVFAERLASPDDHLARHRLADLFIDTLPFNAHTTASDALWAGLPVLTQIGETFAGRVAASLLNAVGLPELIAHSPQEYEALAMDLADNPGKLADLRKRLAHNRLVMPLFNTRVFARHIEAAYEAMYQRCQSGLRPEHIDVAAIET